MDGTHNGMPTNRLSWKKDGRRITTQQFIKDHGTVVREWPRAEQTDQVWKFVRLPVREHGTHLADAPEGRPELSNTLANISQPAVVRLTQDVGRRYLTPNEGHRRCQTGKVFGQSPSQHAWRYLTHPKMDSEPTSPSRKNGELTFITPGERYYDGTQ